LLIESAVALGVYSGEIRVRRLGIEIGTRLPDNGLLQLMLTAQTGQRGRALFEQRFGMIGRRAHVAFVQSHQQLSGDATKRKRREDADESKINGPSTYWNDGIVTFCAQSCRKRFRRFHSNFCRFKSTNRRFMTKC
jgi:hypothetical protein